MNKKRFEYSTGIFIQPDLWNANKQQIAGKTEEAKILNTRLSKVISRVQDIYNQLESKGKPFSILDVRSKMLGEIDEKGVLEVLDDVIKGIKARVGNDYSEGTLKHYKTTRDRLAEFFKMKFRHNDLALSNIDYNLLTSFDLYLKADLCLRPNTALTYHKHLKKVLNTAIAMKLISHNPYSSFKVTRNETHRDFLTLQELNQIQNKKIDISRLDFIRNVFIFASYTGLSFSDIEKLSSNHIQKGSDGNDWVIIDRTKTESRCRIPLLPAAKEVLKKYENNPLTISTSRLLPVYSNQKMNSYLKELADICGIQKKLSMHVARHTFATSVTLTNGVPLETVSKMLGHSSLKTTQIYARIVDTKISQDMNLLQKKLSGEGCGIVV